MQHLSHGINFSHSLRTPFRSTLLSLVGLLMLSDPSPHGKVKKSKDVDLYSAFHAPGTPNAHVTETGPPDRHF